MPGFDRTGPMGEGPRTGRGLGRCNNTNTPESSDVGRGRPVRMGYGRAPGRGLRRGGGWGGRGSGRGRSGGRGRPW